jgi:hypothetical protein
MTTPRLICEPTRKRRYESERAARLAHQRSGKRIRVYLCRDFCGDYHVTTERHERSDPR